MNWNTYSYTYGLSICYPDQLNIISFIWYNLEWPFSCINQSHITSYMSRYLKPSRSLLIIFCAPVYAKSISIISIKMATSKMSCHWSNKIEITQDIWGHQKMLGWHLCFIMMSSGAINKFDFLMPQYLRKQLRKTTHLPFLAAQNNEKQRAEGDNSVW